MEVLTILFWIFFALWCIAVGVWLYTIINRRTRENAAYIYPLIAILVLYITMQIINFIIKLNT